MNVASTLVTSSLPDSNNICNPRVAITDAKITIPCKKKSTESVKKHRKYKTT
jgi:hypothetical protein